MRKTASRLPSAAFIADYESNGHSIFGASKSHRYLHCSGSIFAEFGKPDTGGFEAAEGTVAHEIAAFWLAWGKERQDFNPEVREQDGHRIEVSPAMLNYIGQYVDWCRELIGDHYYEQRVDYSCLTPIPKQGGTADHFCCRLGHLTITDLKYGTGVQVFAEWNTQAMLYALGVIYEWDWLYGFERVTIRICQPRLDHFDVWETTKDELLAWAETAKLDMAACWTPDAPRTPGEHCRFCAALPTCGAYVGLRDRLADATFDDMTVTADELEGSSASLKVEKRFPEVTSLTTVDLSKVSEYRKVMERFFDAAFTEFSRRVLVEHEPMPDGWLLAAGKASRNVVDQAGVTQKMAKAGYLPGRMYTREFKSPAALEGMLVEDGFSKARAVAFIEDFVRKVPGKPTLSLAKPGRVAALDLAEDSFEDES